MSIESIEQKEQVPDAELGFTLEDLPLQLSTEELERRAAELRSRGWEPTGIGYRCTQADANQSVWHLLREMSGGEAHAVSVRRYGLAENLVGPYERVMEDGKTEVIHGILIWANQSNQ